MLRTGRKANVDRHRSADQRLKTSGFQSFSYSVPPSSFFLSSCTCLRLCVVGSVGSDDLTKEGRGSRKKKAPLFKIYFAMIKKDILIHNKVKLFFVPKL